MSKLSKRADTPLTDTSTLRERARSQAEDGMLTHGYNADREPMRRSPLESDDDRRIGH